MFLKIFAKLTEKTPVSVYLFNKVSALRPVTLLKKRLWRRYFYEICENFRSTFFTENLERIAFFSIHLITFNTFFERFLLTLKMLTFKLLSFSVYSAKTWKLTKVFFVTSFLYSVWGDAEIFENDKKPLLLNSWQFLIFVTLKFIELILIVSHLI